MLSKWFILVGVAAVCVGAVSAESRTNALPETIYDMWRIKAEPDAGHVVTMNPPNLKWPHVDGKQSVVYRVELSKDKRFKTGVIRSGDLRACFYNPHSVLSEGTWYWRYEIIAGDSKSHSPTYVFQIDSSTFVFSAPSVDEWVRNLPRQRPYMLTYGRPMKTVVKHARNHPELAEHLIAEGQRVLKKPVINIHTFDQSQMTPRNFTQRILGGEVKIFKPLLYAYLVTGDEVYWRAAEQRVEAFLSWNLRDDMVMSQVWRFLAEAYDTFYPLMDESMKDAIREGCAKWLEKNYIKWAGRTENRQIDNHFWQVEMSGFFFTALALVEDRPDFKKYLDYAYGIFLARHPVLGGTEGGWANGLAYLGVNESTHIDMAYALQSIAKVDVFSLPWYQNLPAYLLYSCAPGMEMDGWGDMHERRQGAKGLHPRHALVLALEKDLPLAKYYYSRYIQRHPDFDVPWLQLISGNIFDRKKEYDPGPLPQARRFEEIGQTAMHTDVEQPEESTTVFFRSSPYGGNGHMHANQNCFNIGHKGKRVFYSTGYYTSFADPHSITSYKHTRAHNGILINGRGQAYGHEGYGWLKRDAHGEKISYVCGDATMAYRPTVSEQWAELTEQYLVKKGGMNIADHFGDAKLARYERHLAFLRPGLVVVYDVLEAETSNEWTYLLHTYEQSVVSSDGLLTYDHPDFHARAVVRGSGRLEPVLTDQFASPAVDFKQKFKGTPNQWHASWSSVLNTPTFRFISLIQVGDEPSDLPPIKEVAAGAYQVGEWTIRAELDTDKEPLLWIESESSLLKTAALPETIFGKPVNVGDVPATLLAEKTRSGVLVNISEDRPPIKAD
jgi:hypothetical protein